MKFKQEYMISLNKYRFLFAGGGTGGHLFPAIAVADKIKSLVPEAEILFVGTKSRIEGTMVPKLGYNFKPIWIKGFARRFDVENILFPLKLLVSIIQSILINFSFKPKVAIGSGGYVAGPAIYGSHLIGSKIILLEQNSFPGATTRLLEKYANEIHLSFIESEKFFRNKNVLKFSGNPVRENLILSDKKDSLKKFSLSEIKKTILVLGGSLGALSINEALAGCVKKFEDNGFQIIWQTGKNYYGKYKNFKSENIFICDFIEDMNSAYSACDVLIARAGATTIAEILVLGIPSVLIPSPNVAGNHQYFNAKSLSDAGSAVIIEDKKLNEKLFDTVSGLLSDNKKLLELKKNSLSLGKPEAASVIAESAVRLAGLR